MRRHKEEGTEREGESVCVCVNKRGREREGGGDISRVCLRKLPQA